MAQEFRQPVAEFLDDVKADYGEIVANRCREEIGVEAEELAASVLIKALETALSDLRQPDLQEAARLQHMPFDSYPE